MVRFALDQIARLCGAPLSADLAEQDITSIATDTRLPFGPNTLFVALDGPNYRGVRFVQEAFAKGACAVIASLESGCVAPAGQFLLEVADPLYALQQLAGLQRDQFHGPLLAITGSNGKTLLKELLGQLVTPQRLITKSPGSFNSFVGIAISLLQLNLEADLALIEVGVSATGEMGPKAAMVRPSHGVLTNVGLAHFEGFGSREKIAAEKMKLFSQIPESGWVLLPNDPLIKDAASRLACRVYFLGDPELPQIIACHNLGEGLSALRLRYPDGAVHQLRLAIDYAFSEVFQTVLAGLSVAHLLGIGPDEALVRASLYQPPMGRIEVWKSPMGSILINDAYSADPVSTQSCLRVFAEYPGRRKVFVFGGMGELGERTEYEHRIVAEELARQKVDVLLTVGELGQKVIPTYLSLRPEGQALGFATTRELTDFIASFAKEGDVIAVKGPRHLNLEAISVRFKAKLTQSIYYLDLDRIRENLVIWRQHLKPGTRILAMIKALAYGADAVQIASFLQSQVDCFGVAYAKEAMSLRQNGIHAEILVQLVLPEDCDDVVRMNLQPSLFDEATAIQLSEAAVRQNRRVKVHLEIDTGMGRFGVPPESLLALALKIQALPGLEIYGLMTHFSSADDPAEDDFTRNQIALFRQAAAQLAEVGIRPTVCHAAATSGAARFPESHFDMVRIGLGLFGVAPSDAVASAIKLKCPIALVAKIGSIQAYPKGSSISYNRTFITSRESLIAYLPIGYHDGLSRRWGKGWHVLIRGKMAPLVGAVCMDFTPVDVTDIGDVAVGDEALIFGDWHGEHLALEDLARLEGTIPYEIVSRLGGRIQRIYRRDEM